MDSEQSREEMEFGRRAFSRIIHYHGDTLLMNLYDDDDAAAAAAANQSRA
jgi:hypothetical protein